MRRAILFAGLLTFVTTAGVFANLDGVFLPGLDHPAIQYHSRPAHDPIAELDRSIQQGTAQLKFDGEQGYLRSLLETLHVPIESQIVPFSKTSVQSYRINPENPRTLFFNDAVTVGWVRGGFIELAAEDPEQGVIFYTLNQKESEKPQFIRRDNNCLGCHDSLNTAGVPGMLVRSVATATDGTSLRWLGNYVTDHRSPLEQRWGGWYVTGNSRTIRHMGNAMVTESEKPESKVTDQTLNLDTLKDKFDTGAYLSPYSDIVALLVFEHQMHMTNLISRMGWETRFALFENQQSGRGIGQSVAARANLTSQLNESAKDFVDYMLFVDEAPLGDKIRGSSGFSEHFAAEGPFDSRGRSLRQFDLQHRLMRFPCSYMIYSAAFQALPAEARDVIYKRMWQILSGEEQSKKYSRLSASDCRAIIEILRETKADLPDYFQAVRR
jgi:hypothetical protein